MLYLRNVCAVIKECVIFEICFLSNISLLYMWDLFAFKFMYVLYLRSVCTAIKYVLCLRYVCTLIQVRSISEFCLYPNRCMCASHMCFNLNQWMRYIWNNVCTPIVISEICVCPDRCMLHLRSVCTIIKVCVIYEIHLRSYQTMWYILDLVIF